MRMQGAAMSWRVAKGDAGALYRPPFASADATNVMRRANPREAGLEVLGFGRVDGKLSRTSIYPCYRDTDALRDRACDYFRGMERARRVRSTD